MLRDNVLDIKGAKVPLLPSMSEVEDTFCRVVLKERTTIPPNSEMLVTGATVNLVKDNTD